MSKEKKWKLFALLLLGGLLVTYFAWTAYTWSGPTQWLAFTFLLFTIFGLTFNWAFGWSKR